MQRFIHQMQLYKYSSSKIKLQLLRRLHMEIVQPEKRNLNKKIYWKREIE